MGRELGGSIHIERYPGALEGGGKGVGILGEVPGDYRHLPPAHSALRKEPRFAGDEVRFVVGVGGGDETNGSVVPPFGGTPGLQEVFLEVD